MYMTHKKTKQNTQHINFWYEVNSAGNMWQM